MDKKLETAKLIIALNTEKSKLESNLSYLDRDVNKDGRSGVKISLRNGHSGGFCWMRLEDDTRALDVVHVALLKYISERVDEIDSELKLIKID